MLSIELHSTQCSWHDAELESLAKFLMQCEAIMHTTEVIIPGEWSPQSQCKVCCKVYGSLDFTRLVVSSISFNLSLAFLKKQEKRRFRKNTIAKRWEKIKKGRENWKIVLIPILLWLLFISSRQFTASGFLYCL